MFNLKRLSFIVIYSYHLCLYEFVYEYILENIHDYFHHIFPKEEQIETNCKENRTRKFVNIIFQGHCKN